MNKNNTGRRFLADLKLYSDFLGYREELGRYETWEEAVEDVMNTHKTKYKTKVEELKPYLDFAEKMYKEKRFLGAMRGLQFRGEDIFKHEFRQYNCLVMYADKPEWIGNAFYLSLCGCGVGVNMLLPFVKRLPNLRTRNQGTKTFIIQDSVEGWADAAHALVSSYCAAQCVEGFEEYQGYELKFDYSLIRERGARVGRRFKAPGPKGLKNALDKIEILINNYLGTEESKEFITIIAYDIFMHLMNAVLSGGIRRAAASVIFSPEDTLMLNCKYGNWKQTNSQRERSNNSVGLLKNTFTKEQFREILALNKGGNDVGFAILNNIFEIFNPCFEIGFTPLYFSRFQDKGQILVLKSRIMKNDITVLDEVDVVNAPKVSTAIQCCNLNEGNMALCKTPQDFYNMCKAEAIMGTLQAGYVNFKHIKGCLAETIAISKQESLLGVSMAGIMNSPWILDKPEILKEGAKIVLEINEKVSRILGINPCARGTCIKPGGDGPIVLECEPSTMGAHSKRQFRIMQLNKDSETAKWLEENMPFLIEESVYSENHTDFVIFVPIENTDGTIYKTEMKGLRHLKVIKTIMDNWVQPGKVEERCIIPTTSHNVSNTIIVDDADYDEVTDYIFENQDSFRAVAFISSFGDKDYNQCPNTSILTAKEIMDVYGEASIFASGLVVDALHAFDNNLWDACKACTDPDFVLTGDRITVFIKKEIIKRFKKFAKNYFKNNLQETIYCLKDVHLYHKWRTINRQFKEVDFTQILHKPNYIDIDTMGAAACAGGACTINRI